ncbi:unnamed protein product [Pseudo-nitzschia multistriata]|uniref:Uncharacterized protein n=1 Tax=Pseudo-nitzschia multistriata TaxID=183589 RepID=A0A448ZSF5_9STRA|nr:unnamed protein product [Pseudo-nitzschia multistriata]
MATVFHNFVIRVVSELVFYFCLSIFQRREGRIKSLNSSFTELKGWVPQPPLSPGGANHSRDQLAIDVWWYDKLSDTPVVDRKQGLTDVQFLAIGIGKS